MCLEFSRVPIASLQKAYDWYSFNVIPAVGEVMLDGALRDCTLWYMLHSMDITCTKVS